MSQSPNLNGSDAESGDAAGARCEVPPAGSNEQADYPDNSIEPDVAGDDADHPACAESEEADGSGVMDEMQQLSRQRDAAEEKYKRALADYQNFQRRCIQNEAIACLQAKASVVRGILPVLDNLDFALSHTEDGGQEESAGFREGVRIVREDLLKALASHGANAISVLPGDEFDPLRHEAVMYTETDDIAENHIAQQLQVGYIIGEIILRPAKVALAKPIKSPEAATESGGRNTPGSSSAAEADANKDKG